MRIIRADAMGMCFGVRDALEVAWQVRRPEETTVLGELVHNEVVIDRMRQRGFRMVAEDRAVPPTTREVLVTAHGISDRERRALRFDGKELIDTTCPLVTRAHDAALALEADDRHVIVIGRPGHVEVRGLIGDLRAATVVAGPAQVRSYPHARLGVLCQTTVPEQHAADTLAAIRAANPDADVHFVDTVCEPTKARTRAARELAGRCDLVVVVGGRNSNNTAQLVMICRSAGAQTYHVQGPDDLRTRWFADTMTVGITAGTSTLGSTVDRIETRLERIAEQLAVRPA
ncbi:MAG: 4-hydroxy-3-methylbut-2-enyl diphosphate reductase [Planctomycetes bacterium]|nr:4-hydroxy-3-methylbut-2-enyl diphosphate reductase [Planctomycetota bacterium]